MPGRQQTRRHQAGRRRQPSPEFGKWLGSHRRDHVIAGREQTATPLAAASPAAARHRARQRNAVSRIGHGRRRGVGGSGPLWRPAGDRAAARWAAVGCGDGKSGARARDPRSGKAALRTPRRTGVADARRHDQRGDEQKRVGHARGPTAERCRPSCRSRACHYRHHAILTSADRSRPPPADCDALPGQSCHPETAIESTDRLVQ